MEIAQELVYFQRLSNAHQPDFTTNTTRATEEKIQYSIHMEKKIR